MKRRIFLTSIFALYISILSSCSAGRQTLAFLRTPKGFVPISDAVRVENRADEQFAKNIREILPYLIDSVETKHLHQFIHPPKVYLCGSNQSFCQYTGSKFPGPRAFANKAIFISPRLKASKDWIDIIYHELSHVLLFQHLGVYHYRTIPEWFHEGLATYLSNGGGSGDVTDSAAIAAIATGNHFYPVAKENVVFPKSFSNDKIPAWMHYRQAMLFVKFMREGREKEFDVLLNAVFKKKSFSKSVKNAYGAEVAELWDEFLATLKDGEK